MVGIVFALAPSVVLVLVAYARLARLFSDPHQIELLTVANLRASLAPEILAMGEDAETTANHWSELRARPFLVERSEASHEDGFAVTYQGEPATLLKWDFGQLDRATAFLDAESGPTASESPVPEEADVTGALVKLLLGPGAQVMSGDPILRVYGVSANVNSRRLLRAQRAFRLAAITDGNDWRTRIRAEMADLEDSVLEAVRAGRLGRTERGYTYYREVINWIRAESRRQGGRAAPEQLRWIESQAWEVDEAAVQAGPRFAMAATSAAQARCGSAVRSHDLPALQAALVTFPHAWRLLLDSPSSSEDAQEHLLVSLQNVAEFVIPAELADRSAAVEGARACIWTYVEMIKHSIDGPGLGASALRALDYMMNLYRFGRPDLEGARLHQNAGLIALAAWVLYCQEKRDSLNEIDPQALLDRVERRSVGKALAVLDERDAFAGQWRFWETRDSLPLVAQSLELSSYAIRAGLLAMRGSPGFAILSDDDLSLAQRLVHTSEALGGVRDVAQYRVANTVEALRKMISDWEEKQSLILAELPLEQARVDAFAAGLRSSLLAPPRLVELFTGQTPSPSWMFVGQRRVLGLNVIVPKVYFVESPRTIAPPEDLARQLANAMVRGEHASIVEHCLRFCQEHQARVADLAEILGELAAGMSEPVAITSSYEALAALGARDYETGQVRLGGTTIRVSPLFDTDSLERKVILVDRLHGLDALREPETKPDLEPLSEVGVAYGVFTHESRGVEPRARVEIGELLQWRIVEEPRIHGITLTDEGDPATDVPKRVN